MTDLVWAKSVLDADAPSSWDDYAKALEMLANASANLDLRPQIQDISFQRLLSLFSAFASSTEEGSSDSTLWRNLLRIIGNMIADNGRQRMCVSQQVRH